jgi:hypothetical protein
MLAALLPVCLSCTPAPLNTIGEYEAEKQLTSGTIIGPDRRFGTVAAEASGRAAVRLDRSDQFILFKLSGPARGLTVRYSLPASGAWRRKPSAVVIDADGHPLATLPLTSAYALQPFAHPASARPVHHFWDEVRLLLRRSLPAGTTMSLRLAKETGAAGTAIDLIDMEEVPPPEAAPPGAILLGQFRPDASGRRSSRKALIRAIAAARKQHKPLYIPPGHYRVDGHLTVDRVTVAGAGSWYSVIGGHNVGFYARHRGSSRVSLSSLAVESDVSSRQDRLPTAAIGGRFSNSSFTNLYLSHAKVGIWLDGPAHNLLVRGVVIANQAADGINLHRGIRNAVVESNRIRNTGDDAIASWSEDIANELIAIRNNRVSAPGLANGIAIYGGRNIAVVGNRVADILVEGGGIHLGARFRVSPFGGKILIADNVVTRAGTMDPNWHFGVGAIWIYALERSIMADIVIVRNRVEDAGCEAVQLLGPNRIGRVAVEDLRITGPLTSVFALQTGGSLIATAVAANVVPSDPVVEVPPGFMLEQGDGNRGWTVRKSEAARLPECA